MMTSRSLLRRIRGASEKNCIENQNTRFMVNNGFPNPAVYEIMWKIIEDPDRPKMTI